MEREEREEVEMQQEERERERRKVNCLVQGVAVEKPLVFVIYWPERAHFAARAREQ